MLTSKVTLVGAAAVLTLLAAAAVAILLPIPATSGGPVLSTPAPLPSAPAAETLPALSAEAGQPALDSESLPSEALTLPAAGEFTSEFILRQYGETIGVFEAGSDLPFMTIEVPVSSLRAADADRLRAGISVMGRMELARLVEDLGS